MSKTEPITVADGLIDILPDAADARRFVLNILQRRATSFGFEYLETPLLEKASLFERLGTKNDLDQKTSLIEIAQHTETNGPKLILRPDLISGMIRAAHAELFSDTDQSNKVWQLGPVTRAHETPKAFQIEQAWQAAYCVFQDGHPAADAMLIYLVWEILGDLQIREDVVVDINSLGCRTCRPKYLKLLREYYQSQAAKLCPVCKKNLPNLPTKLLICQMEDCHGLQLNAPQSVESLCINCKEHFLTVLESLDELGIIYNLQSSLIDELENTNRTLFTLRQSSQTEPPGVLLAHGNRTDNLVELLGGKTVPLITTIINLDAIMQLLEGRKITYPSLPRPDLYIIQLGEKAKKASYAIIAQLGDEGLSAVSNPSKDNLKVQLNMAEKLEVRFTVIIGQREAIDGTVILRDMIEGTQETLDQQEIAQQIRRRLANSAPSSNG